MQLLFERLTETLPQSQLPKPAQLENLQKSVIAELSRLFSTRNYFGGRTGPEFNLLNFGIPRLVDYSQSNHTDLAALRSEIEKAVRQFEPRLKDPVIQQHVDKSATNPVFLTITGRVELDNESSQVVFPITADIISV